MAGHLTQDRVWDAVVVGAGPAGATCARWLASCGRRVLVVDRSRWPRYKTCGGGLIGRVSTRLDSAAAAAIEMRVDRAELHIEGTSRTFEVERDGAMVALCMRATFDAALMAAAQGAGAVFEDNCELTAMQPAPEGWILGVGAHRRLRTRCVVGADGAGSRVARLAGWGGSRGLVAAIESEIEVDAATHQRFAGAVRFDFGPVPTGYAWVFPKAAHLSVGCLTHDRRKPRLRPCLDRYLHDLGIRPHHREDHGFAIPVRPRATVLARNQVLLTGDAAGLADPVTCEGISNAIASGRLAAEAVARSDPDRASTCYQRQLEASILPQLRRARLLARGLYHYPRLRRYAFQRFGEPLAEAMADLIDGETSYGELLGGPSRWLRIGLHLLRPSIPPTYPNG